MKISTIRSNNQIGEFHYDDESRSNQQVDDNDNNEVFKCRWSHCIASFIDKSEYLVHMKSHRSSDHYVSTVFKHSVGKFRKGDKVDAMLINGSYHCPHENCTYKTDTKHYWRVHTMLVGNHESLVSSSKNQTTSQSNVKSDMRRLESPGLLQTMVKLKLNKKDSTDNSTNNQSGSEKEGKTKIQSDPLKEFKTKIQTNIHTNINLGSDIRLKLTNQIPAENQFKPTNIALPVPPDELHLHESEQESQSEPPEQYQQLLNQSNEYVTMIKDTGSFKKGDLVPFVKKDKYYCIHKNCSAAFLDNRSWMTHIHKPHNGAYVILSKDAGKLKAGYKVLIPVDGRFICIHEDCGKQFDRRSLWIRHINTSHSNRSISSSHIALSETIGKFKAGDIVEIPKTHPYKCIHLGCNIFSKCSSSWIRHVNSWQTHRDSIGSDGEGGNGNKNITEVAREVDKGKDKKGAKFVKKPLKNDINELPKNERFTIDSRPVGSTSLILQRKSDNTLRLKRKSDSSLESKKRSATSAFASFFTPSRKDVGEDKNTNKNASKLDITPRKKHKGNVDLILSDYNHSSKDDKDSAVENITPRKKKSTIDDIVGDTIVSPSGRTRSAIKKVGESSSPITETKSSPVISTPSPSPLKQNKIRSKSSSKQSTKGLPKVTVKSFVNIPTPTTHNPTPTHSHSPTTPTPTPTPINHSTPVFASPPSYLQNEPLSTIINLLDDDYLHLLNPKITLNENYNGLCNYYFQINYNNLFVDQIIPIGTSLRMPIEKRNRVFGPFHNNEILVQYKRIFVSWIMIIMKITHKFEVDYLDELLLNLEKSVVELSSTPNDKVISQRALIHFKESKNIIKVKVEESDGNHSNTDDIDHMELDKTEAAMDLKGNIDIAEFKEDDNIHRKSSRILDPWPGSKFDGVHHPLECLHEFLLQIITDSESLGILLAAFTLLLVDKYNTSKSGSITVSSWKSSTEASKILNGILYGMRIILHGQLTIEHVKFTDDTRRSSSTEAFIKDFFSSDTGRFAGPFYNMYNFINDDLLKMEVGVSRDEIDIERYVKKELQTEEELQSKLIEVKNDIKLQEKRRHARERKQNERARKRAQKIKHQQEEAQSKILQPKEEVGKQINKK